VVGMGLVSAWVLVTLTGLTALGFAASAWRLTRTEQQRGDAR
jgi:hypothetical protein